jgi:hypothetical protein
MKLGQFIRKSLPTAESALDGGTFSISAEMRTSGLGKRWKRLCTWKAGLSVDDALGHALAIFKKLPREDREQKFTDRWETKLF